MCAHCPFTFIDVEDRSWMFFLYFINNTIQIDLPLKMINVSLSRVNKLNALTSVAILFPVLICLKNGQFATFVI